MGISDFAQDALGDVVYVELPETGASVSAGDAFAEIESTKSVSDIYAPVGGTVTAVNSALEDNPELINSDPYGDGWVCEIELSNEADFDDLMDKDTYISQLE